MLPSYEDVERAIGSVPGVASASLAPDERTGRGRLRIRTDADHDPSEVSLAVARLLSDRFGIDIDPAELHPPAGGKPREVETAEPVLSRDEDAGATEAEAPAPDEESAPPPDAAGEETPEVGSVTVAVEGLVARVDAVLHVAGRELRGHAVGPATPAATLRAAARATLDALEEGHSGRIKTELGNVMPSHDGETEVVTVTVTVLTRDGSRKVVGAALADDDTPQAVARATVDAVGRLPS